MGGLVSGCHQHPGLPASRGKGLLVLSFDGKGGFSRGARGRCQGGEVAGVEFEGEEFRSFGFAQDDIRFAQDDISLRGWGT